MSLCNSFPIVNLNSLFFFQKDKPCLLLFCSVFLFCLFSLFCFFLIMLDEYKIIQPRYYKILCILSISVLIISLNNVSFIHKLVSQQCYTAAEDSLGSASTYTCTSQKCNHSVSWHLVKKWWELTDKNETEKHHSIFWWPHGAGAVTHSCGYFYSASFSLSLPQLPSTMLLP